MLRARFTGALYPFQTRLQWHAKGRHAHIIDAVRLHPRLQDTLVHERVRFLRRAGAVRAVVLALLYLGAIAALLAYLGAYVPALGSATEYLGDLAAIAGGFTGLFALIALALTRLLGQIEADILMLLILDQQLRPKTRGG